MLAEGDDVEIDIPEGDSRVDVYKSAGAGGQNVQKNATAVRLTHLPTGIVVACQDERSQLQNRIRAMSILRARLYEIEEEKQRQEREEARRSQVGSGERSEKIRTYNYPQSRVTDHRINLSSYNLAAVMDGDIDTFIDELATRDEAERLAELAAPGMARVLSPAHTLLDGDVLFVLAPVPPDSHRRANLDDLAQAAEEALVGVDELLVEGGVAGGHPLAVEPDLVARAVADQHDHDVGPDLCQLRVEKHPIV